MKIAFMGGTGPAGIGIGARLARAGHAIVIGSRSAERAEDAAAKVRALVGGDEITSGENASIIEDADIVFLTVKDDAQRDTVRQMRDAFEGKIVVSMANPLRVYKGEVLYMPQPEGSLAEEVQRDARGARVVSAFHEIRVQKFSHLDEPIDADTIICGDDEDAKKVVMGLAEQVGVRPVDGGPLMNARYVEAFVAVLISINFRYKAQTSYKITGLPS